MEILYTILMIIISVLIIIVLIILIKTMFDIDKNVIKSRTIINNVSDISKNVKEEQEKIQTIINNKIDTVNFVSKIKIAKNLINTFSNLYKNKRKNKN